MRATILVLCLLAVPAFAQAPTPPAASAPVPLPQWFVEIDTAKKGEVSRADFLNYRMRSFGQLDIDKDGKLSRDEFIKIAEPPYSTDMPGGPNLEERRNRARRLSIPGHQRRRLRRARRSRSRDSGRVQPLRRRS
jgi:hypothetical protein